MSICLPKNLLPQFNSSTCGISISIDCVGISNLQSKCSMQVNTYKYCNERVNKGLI